MLDNLGNIGEFVGAIGIVVTLIYLGFQVHQNTKLLRLNMIVAVRQLTSTNTTNIIQPGAAELINKGINTYPDDMNSGDRLRFIMLLSTLINNMEIEWNSDRSGLTNQQHEWGYMRYWLSKPGGKRFWEDQAKNAFGNDFREFVETKLMDE